MHHDALKAMQVSRDGVSILQSLLKEQAPQENLHVLLGLAC